MLEGLKGKSPVKVESGRKKKCNQLLGFASLVGQVKKEKNPRAFPIKEAYFDQSIVI